MPRLRGKVFTGKTGRRGVKAGMERLEGLKVSELEISKSVDIGLGLDVSTFDLFYSGTSL